jgi:catechol 2,3-dioxygenase-like lactoylglutathione lyase family enzyme
MVARIRYGIQTTDHIAIPVRDLTLNQSFYSGVLGLKFKTPRRNPDGSPRQTYVLAGENIIGLHLPASARGHRRVRRRASVWGVSPERPTGRILPPANLNSPIARVGPHGRVAGFFLPQN